MKRPQPTLTTRQKEVLKRVVDGQSYKHIAFDIGLTESGVQRNIDRIKMELRIDSIAKLTHYALAKKMVKNEYAK